MELTEFGFSREFHRWIVKPGCFTTMSPVKPRNPSLRRVGLGGNWQVVPENFDRAGASIKIFGAARGVPRKLVNFFVPRR